MQPQPRGAENMEQLLRSANGIAGAVQLITVNGKYNDWRNAHVAAIAPAVLAPTEVCSELSSLCPHTAAPRTGHRYLYLHQPRMTFLGAFS